MYGGGSTVTFNTPLESPYSDGPEVEHGAHFLILYYTHRTLNELKRTHGETD